MTSTATLTRTRTRHPARVADAPPAPLTDRQVAAVGLRGATPITPTELRPGMDVARLTATTDGLDVCTLRVARLTGRVVVSAHGDELALRQPAHWFALPASTR